jgi:hypothetical protein
MLHGADAGTVLLNSNGSGTPQTLGFTFGTYGQGVYVSTDTTLNQIGIWIGNPAGGTAEFQIWNSTNTTLLYSKTQEVAAFSGTELLLSKPFSFKLVAGNTYYFDVIGAYSKYGDQELGFIPGTAAQTQNGLALVWPNSVYQGPTQPSGFAQGSFTLPLELIGTQGKGDRGRLTASNKAVESPCGSNDAPVPKPATIGLIALGCAAVGWRLKTAA